MRTTCKLSFIWIARTWTQQGSFPGSHIVKWHKVTQYLKMMIYIWIIYCILHILPFCGLDWIRFLLVRRDSWEFWIWPFLMELFLISDLFHLFSIFKSPTCLFSRTQCLCIFIINYIIKYIYKVLYLFQLKELNIIFTWSCQIYLLTLHLTLQYEFYFTSLFFVLLLTWFMDLGRA